MSLIQFLFTTVSVMVSITLGVLNCVASEQIVALSDTQSVVITFPDTSYHYRTPEGCEGSHCVCNYGEPWRLLKSLTVYAAFKDTSRSVGQFAVGDTVVAQEGYMVVDRPGVVMVRDTVQHWLDGRTFRNVLPGDTLFVMQPTCETHHIVWYKTEFIDIEGFWSGSDYFRTSRPEGHQIMKPQLSWWVKVTSSLVKEGWLRIQEDQVFDGVGRCCPRFKM